MRPSKQIELERVVSDKTATYQGNPIIGGKKPMFQGLALITVASSDTLETTLVSMVAPITQLIQLLDCWGGNCWPGQGLGITPPGLYWP